MIFNAELFASEMPPMQLDAIPQLQAGGRQSAGLRQERYPALYNVSYGQKIRKGTKIWKKIEELASLLNEINKRTRHVKKENDLTRLVRELLDSIRFLFKSDHYKEEEEVRVVRMSYYAGNEEKPEYRVDMDQIPPRFYLEMPGDFRFSEVILGPNTRSRVPEWEQWIREIEREKENKGVKVTPLKIRQSKIKFGRSIR